LKNKAKEELRKRAEEGDDVGGGPTEGAESKPVVLSEFVRGVDEDLRAVADEDAADESGSDIEWGKNVDPSEAVHKTEPQPNWVGQPGFTQPAFMPPFGAWNTMNLNGMMTPANMFNFAGPLQAQSLPPNARAQSLVFPPMQTVNHQTVFGSSGVNVALLAAQKAAVSINAQISAGSASPSALFSSAPPDTVVAPFVAPTATATSDAPSIPTTPPKKRRRRWDATPEVVTTDFDGTPEVTSAIATEETTFINIVRRTDSVAGETTEDANGTQRASNVEVPQSLRRRRWDVPG
jgi:hypothetical protein